MSSDEEETNVIQCLKCKKEICGKPWLIVGLHEGYTVYGCSYLCANQFRELIGFGYWKNIINKEDFNEPRPVFGYTNRSFKGDITTGFDMDEITFEIEEETKRIEMIEELYECSSSDSDEEKYDY